MAQQTENTETGQIVKKKIGNPLKRPLKKDRKPFKKGLNKKDRTPFKKAFNKGYETLRKTPFKEGLSKGFLKHDNYYGEI